MCRWLLLLCAIGIVVHGAHPAGEDEDAVAELGGPGAQSEEVVHSLSSVTRAAGVKRLSTSEKKPSSSHERTNAQSDLNKGSDAKSLLAHAEAALKAGNSAKAQAYLDAAKKARKNTEELKVNAPPAHLLDVLRQQEKESKAPQEHGARSEKVASGSLSDQIESLIQVNDASDLTDTGAVMSMRDSATGQGAASTLSVGDPDLGEGLAINGSPFPVMVDNYHPAQEHQATPQRQIPQHTRTQTTASRSETAAEDAGFSQPVVKKVPKPQTKHVQTSIRHGTSRPQHHEQDSVEDDTRTGSDMAPGPAELGGAQTDDEHDLGEGVSVGTMASVSARLAACEARVVDPTTRGPKSQSTPQTCSGHGAYEIREGANGMMEVACKCNTGWTGPDCRTGCPAGANHVECTGNGHCEFHPFPDPVAQCKCSNLWKGGVCDMCSLKSLCANGAQPDDLCSKCNCPNKWAGVHCTTCSLRCLNSGTPDDDCAQCKCTNAWQGASCDTCGFKDKCLHGVAKADCSGCHCGGNWVGKHCDQCNIYCANGVPNSDCTGCVCSNEWTGDKCDKCKMGTACRNGAVASSSCDSCVCPKESFWQGSFCHVCGLVCINGQAGDDCKRCKCTGNWSGKRCDKCKLACTYGTPNPTCDTCLCPGGWTGALCSTCALKCESDYERDSTCTQCIRKSNERHSLAFNGKLNVGELENPLKPNGEAVSTIEFRVKTLRDKGIQGILCNKQHFKGSFCVYLDDSRVALSVVGNHVTSRKAIVSSPTQIFDYRLNPYVGYSVAVVYSTLPEDMAYAKLYVNGKLRGTKFYAVGNTAVLSEALVGGIEGHRAYFQGFLDDVRFWSSARSALQIQQLYNKELVGIEQGLIASFQFNQPRQMQYSAGTSKWAINVHNILFSDEFMFVHKHTQKITSAPIEQN